MVWQGQQKAICESKLGYLAMCLVFIGTVVQEYSFNVQQYCILVLMRIGMVFAYPVTVVKYNKTILYETYISWWESYDKYRTWL